MKALNMACILAILVFLPALFTDVEGCAIKTTADNCCMFPFTYKGVKYYKCTTKNHDQPWCSLTSVYKGQWGNCVPGCVERTTAGKCCKFPFIYKGVTYYKCTTKGHSRPWCSLTSVYKGKWGNCAGCAMKTTDDHCCMFPFIYKGVTYYKCTTKNHHRQWCSLTSVYKGKWGNCGCAVRTTTRGKCCVFPFTYKGVKYYKCTTKNHSRPWCSLTSVYKGKWGNCQ